MQWQDRFRRARAEWMLLTFYERFEQVVILILTGLIAIVVVFAVWNLALKIFHAVIAPQTFDPTEYSVFQAVFGAIFTVIIALEFKRSLLVVAHRQESIVQVRTVIPDCASRHRSQIDDPRSGFNRVISAFRACGSHLGAWCSLLARSRPRSKHRT
jgi:hypothetical protein